MVAAGAKPSKGGAPPPPGALDSFKYKHTPEDADALATELIPAKFATDLADPNWKVRLAALEEMTDWVSGAAGELDSEVVVRFLGKKGWNEKNFQVRQSSTIPLIVVHLLAGFHKAVWDPWDPCEGLPVLRSLFRRIGNTTFVREIGRYEAEEACRRDSCHVRREDVVAICFGSRLVPHRPMSFFPC